MKQPIYWIGMIILAIAFAINIFTDKVLISFIVAIIGVIVAVKGYSVDIALADDAIRYEDVRDYIEPEYKTTMGLPKENSIEIPVEDIE